MAGIDWSKYAKKPADQQQASPSVPAAPAAPDYIEQAYQNTKPAVDQPEQPGIVKKGIDLAFRPVADNFAGEGATKEQMTRAVTGHTGQELHDEANTVFEPKRSDESLSFSDRFKRMANPLYGVFNPETPEDVGKRSFLLNFAGDVGELPASFTNPVSLVGGAEGAAGKSLKGLEAVGDVANAAKAAKTVRTLGLVNKTLGAAAGVSGAQQIADTVSKRGTDPSAYTPDDVHNLLFGGAAVAGGGAGVMPRGIGSLPLSEVPGGFVDAVRDVPRAVGNVARKPFQAGLNQPIEGTSLTRRDVTKFAKDKGIDLNIAEATNNPVANFGEKYAADSWTGANKMARGKQQRGTQLGDAVTADFGSDLDREGAGNLVQTKIRGAADASKQAVNDKYAALDEVAGKTGNGYGGTVETAPMKQYAAQELAKKTLVADGKTRQFLQNVVDLPDLIDFQTAHQMRSEMGEIGYNHDSLTGNRAQGKAKNLRSLFDAQMERGANADYDDKDLSDLIEPSPELGQGFRDADAAYKTHKQTFEDGTSYLNTPREAAPDTAKLMDRVLSARTPQSARQLGSVLGEDGMSALRGEIVRRAQEHKQGLQSGLRQFAPKGDYGFLQTVFGDKFNDLMSYGSIDASLKKNVNPSGSGGAAQRFLEAGGAGVVGAAHPVAAVAGLALPRGIAQAIESPGLTDFLTESPKAAKPSAPRGISKGGAQPQVAANPFGGTRQAVGRVLRKTGSVIRDVVSDPSDNGGAFRADAGAAVVKAAGKGVAKLAEKAADVIEPKPGNAAVMDSAREYNRLKGLPATTPTFYQRVDERAPQIADAYDAMEHNPSDPKVKASYDALKREVKAQYEHAQQSGITFEPSKENPYSTSKQMMSDVKDNQRLKFFQGGDMPQDHPLAEVDKQTGLSYNDMLRAVHDLYGHAKNGYEFGARGEENAWLAHRQMFTPDALPALTTETKGQNSWVNAGSHLRNEAGAVPAKGEEGYVAPKDRPYAQQKAGLLPAEFHSRPDIPATQSSPMKITHYSHNPDITELDTEKFGTSFHGAAERSRAGDKGFTKRVYAVDDSGRYREPSKTNLPYSYEGKVDANRYYDIEKDPKGLWQKAIAEGMQEQNKGNGSALTYAENKLREYGFDGYTHGGAVASFANIPVRENFIHPEIDKNLQPDEKADFKTAESKRTLNKTYRSLPSVEEYAEAAKAGGAIQKWYQNSKAGFDELTRTHPNVFHPEDQKMFTDLVAALSPKNPVKQNLIDAVDVYTRYRQAVDSGKELKAGDYGQMLRGIGLKSRKINATKVLQAGSQGADLSGYKVDSFTKNLQGNTDKVTSDGWMALFGATDKSLQLPSTYHALTAKTRAAAKVLGWEPAEAQAGVWGFIKTLAEESGWGKDSWTPPTEVLQHMTHADVAKRATDFRDLMANDPDVRALLKKKGVDVDTLKKNLDAVGQQGSTQAFDRNVLEKTAGRLDAARAKKAGADTEGAGGEAEGDTSFPANGKTVDAGGTINNVKPPREYFSKGSYLDYGFPSHVGGMDMGMSTTYEMNGDASKLSPQEAAKVFTDHLQQEYGKKYESTPDGKIVVYHGTSEPRANKLVKNGAKSGLFVAAKPDGDYGATHYGDHVVKLAVDPRDLTVIDDTGDAVILSDKNKAEHYGK